MDKINKAEKFTKFDQGNRTSSSSGKQTGTVRSVPANLSKFRNPYLTSIYDPEGCRGVGIPDDFVVQSQKIHVTSRFSGVCGGTVDNACGFVALNPHFLVANNTNTVYTTSNAYTSLVVSNTGTGVAPHNSNSLYTVSDLQRLYNVTANTTSATAGKRFRLVSCRMRVESMASVTSNFGEMAGLVTPTHESVIGMSYQDITSFSNSVNITAQQGNAIELFYTPVWPAELQYHNLIDQTTAASVTDRCRFLLDPAAMQISPAAAYAQNALTTPGVMNETNVYQPFMVVMFDGSDQIPFRVEIEANFEVVGLQIGQLVTPSPYSAPLMDQAKKAFAVAPTAAASVSGSPNVGRMILDQMPKLLKFAEDQVLRMLPAPVEIGYNLIKELL